MQTMTLTSPSHQGATPSAGVRLLSATSIIAPLMWLSKLAPSSSARGAQQMRQQMRQWTHWSSAASWREMLGRGACEVGLWGWYET